MKRGNDWERKRQAASRSQTRGAVVLSSRLRWDKLLNSWSSAISLFLRPLSLKKEEKKEGEERREEGEKRSKWKPDTWPCLVWMGAAGRMMSHIWSGLFSLPFPTYWHFFLFLCKAPSFKLLPCQLTWCSFDFEIFNCQCILLLMLEKMTQVKAQCSLTSFHQSIYYCQWLIRSYVIFYCLDSWWNALCLLAMKFH